MLVLTAVGHVPSAKAEKGDFIFMLSEIHFSNDEQSARNKPQLIDLGFCPRCRDVIDGLKGLKSRVVAGVKFCVFCAWHVENDSSELQMYVAWAEKSQEVHG